MGGTGSLSFLSILTFLFALVAVGASSGLNQTVLVVSFDGLGWEFVDSKRTNTPNFDFFASGGVKAKNLLGVHPTKTFPAHATFLTGLYPESHGIIDNKFWDPLYMEKFILEHDCSNFDPKFYNESEPIWLTMQKQGMKSGAFYWPGSTSYSTKPTFYEEPFCYLKCDDYKGPMLEYLRLYLKIHCFFNWAKSFQKRIDTVLEWLTSDDPPRLTMLYFEQPDIAGHKNGPNSETYVRKIEEIDREVVGYLVERLMKLQLMHKVNVVLLSDHGMIETSDKRQIRIRDYVEPDSYFKNIAAPEHIWPKPGKLNEIYAKLKNAKNPHLKVYKNKDIPEEYHWKNNRRIPPIYLVAEEGWLMRQDYNPLAEGQWIEGTHGWPPTEKSAGIFYARGPAFKEGYTSNISKRAIDVYALLCHIVGAKPLANNGSLENMAEFLKKTPTLHHKENLGTPITSHTVFTPTITNQTPSISAQTKTEQSQWFTQESRTQQDSTNPPQDIPTKTTASTLPQNQRQTNKEQHQRSGSFVRQHTAVNGHSSDHKSLSSPQNNIKATPTATETMKQLQQSCELPQTETDSAMRIIESTASSLDANTFLTQGSGNGKAAGVNEKRNEKTSGCSSHASARTTHKNKKRKTALFSQKVLTSRSSNLNQKDLVKTSYHVTLNAKLSAHTIRKSRLQLPETTTLKSTPDLTLDLQPSNTALKDEALTRTSIDSKSFFTTIFDDQRFTKPSPTTSKEKDIPSSAVTTDTLSLVLSTSSQTTSDSLNKLKSWWNCEDNYFASTKIAKTATGTNSPKITSQGALVSRTNTNSDFAATTSTKTMTESDLNKASTAPMVGKRADSKVVALEGKELNLGTTTPISATLTHRSKIAPASIDVSSQNTVTKRTKEQLMKAVDNDTLMGGNTTALQQQQLTSRGVATHTTENALSENVLRTKTPDVLVVSSKQVQPSIASDSSIATLSTSSNSTRNNASNAYNSSNSNDTTSEKSDEDDVKTSAPNDCPPGFEEDVQNDDQMDDYSGNSEALSSARTTAKQFSYLEAAMIFIIVKLNAWLCL